MEFLFDDSNHKLNDLGIQLGPERLPDGAFRFGVETRTQRAVENSPVIRQVHHETVDSISFSNNMLITCQIFSQLKSIPIVRRSVFVHTENQSVRLRSNQGTVSLQH